MVGGSLAELAKRGNQQSVQQVAELRITDVEPNPNQVRKQFRDIDDLAASIDRSGLQQPIIVADKNKSGKYIIINGERRWRASVQSGQRTIRAIVRDNPDEQLRVMLELTENIQRDNLSAGEIAGALAKLRALGCSNDEIANKLGKSLTYVSRHLKLSKAPEEVAGLEQNGIRDLNALCDMIELRKRDRARYDALRQDAVSNTLTRQTVREALKSVKQRASGQSRNQKTAPVTGKTAHSVVPAQAQVRVVVHGEAGDYEAHLDLAKPSSKGLIWVKRAGEKQSHEVASALIELQSVSHGGG